MSSTALFPSSVAGTGRALRIVDLQPGDTGTVQAVFDGLSDRSRYLRFHTGLPRLSAPMLHLLAAVRPGQHAAHVAWLAGHPVGLVRWIRYPDVPDVADLAVEVVDALQECGVARALAMRAAESADEVAVRTFVACVLPGNRVVRSWALALGGTFDRGDRTQLQIPVAALLPWRDGPQAA